MLRAARWQVNQDEFNRLGSVELTPHHFNPPFDPDAPDPLCREWALFALKCLTEDHEANQVILQIRRCPAQPCSMCGR